MASFNRVVILGNLGQDPELRYTPTQVAVCTLSIATTDYRTGADGQRIEQTEWHRVVVFSKQAENCQKYLAKGRSVLVEGRLQTRSWEDQKSGQKRYSTEIIAQTVQFIGGGSQAVRGQAQAAPGAQAGSTPNAGGAFNYGAGSQGYGGGGGGGAPAPTGGGSYGGASRSGADSGRRFDSDPGDLGGDPGEYGGGTPPAGLEDIPF